MCQLKLLFTVIYNIEFSSISKVISTLTFPAFPLGKFSKLIEDDRQTKEKLKNKNSEDLKNFENKIKEMMNEEREFLKNYV